MLVIWATNVRHERNTHYTVFEVGMCQYSGFTIHLWWKLIMFRVSLWQLLKYRPLTATSPGLVHCKYFLLISMSVLLISLIKVWTHTLVLKKCTDISEWHSKLVSFQFLIHCQVFRKENYTEMDIINYYSVWIIGYCIDSLWFTCKDSWQNPFSTDNGLC